MLAMIERCQNTKQCTTQPQSSHSSPAEPQPPPELNNGAIEVTQVCAVCGDHGIHLDVCLTYRPITWQIHFAGGLILWPKCQALWTCASTQLILIFKNGKFYMFTACKVYFFLPKIWLS